MVLELVEPPAAGLELPVEFILEGGCLLLGVAVDAGNTPFILLGLWLGLRSRANLESCSSYWHVWKTLFIAILIWRFVVGGPNISKPFSDDSGLAFVAVLLDMMAFVLGMMDSSTTQAHFYTPQ